MKKLLFIILISTFNISCSQNLDVNYEKDLKDLRLYVWNVYTNDHSKIKTYVKNVEDGKIYQLKGDDVYEEYGNMYYENIYQFVERDDKIVCVRQLTYYWAEAMAFTDISYEYYFDNNKRLIGATKVHSFDIYSEKDDKSYKIFYKLKYLLNKETDKLEKQGEVFVDENNNPIDLNSYDYKDDRKYILSKIKKMKSITFRDLEGLMIAEKIKYYN